MTKKQSDAVWEASYRGAGKDRLWPQTPTIQQLDLGAWQASGLRSVLDAGCGDGKNLAYLVGNGFFVLGADASASALQKCQSHLQKEGLRRDYVLLSPTTLTQIPLLDESLDASICVDVLGHLEDPIAVLRELARLLRPGGLLYASTFHVDDECRTGPRMRPGSLSREFWYRPSSEIDVEYFFRFYDEEGARILFKSSNLHLRALTSHRWKEPPHPGYRDEWHTHESWFALLEK